MNGKCFLCMPYGKTPVQKVHYDKMYHVLESSIMDCGLTCIRSDINNVNGSIIANVLDNLARAEFVVAVLADLNWNVAYELGIRHALVRRGTILLYPENEKIPFDIAQLKVICYSQEWTAFPHLLTDPLSDVIRRLQKCTSGTDSPVFERFNSLPDRIISDKIYFAAGCRYLGDNDENLSENTSDSYLQLILEDDKIEETDKPRFFPDRIVSDEIYSAAGCRYLSDNEENLSENTSESDSLLIPADDKIEETDKTRDCKSLPDSFFEEYQKAPPEPQEALHRMRTLIRKKKFDEFILLLKQTLDEGCIAMKDVMTICELCRETKKPYVTITFLEVILRIYPDIPGLHLQLAREYCQSINTVEKAFLLINARIGAAVDHGCWSLNSPEIPSLPAIHDFFIFYESVKKYDDILTVGELLLDRCPDNSTSMDVVCSYMENARQRMKEYSTRDNLPDSSKVNSFKIPTAIWKFGKSLSSPQYDKSSVTQEMYITKEKNSSRNPT